jgi:toxin ParE1/3/4
MRYRVEISALARRDLERIYRYIQAEESRQAAKWFNRLEIELRSLSEMPERSPLARENSELRHLLYGNKPDVYRIVYRIRIDRGTVTILTIRHGARDQFRAK